MKKFVFLLQLTAAVILYPSFSYADDYHGWRGHGYGHHHRRGHHGHHHKHYYPQPQINYYYPAPQVHYYPQPQVHYHPQPPVEYYPQESRHYRDPRSTQGLAGGVIGSVFGYQMGSGDPVITGIGAAAGSYLGNEIAGR